MENKNRRRTEKMGEKNKNRRRTGKNEKIKIKTEENEK